jgi:hypothetical protein
MLASQSFAPTSAVIETVLGRKRVTHAWTRPPLYFRDETRRRAFGDDCYNTHGNVPSGYIEETEGRLIISYCRVETHWRLQA